MVSAAHSGYHLRAMAEKQPQADGGRLTPMKIVSVDARPVDTDTDPSPGPTTDPGLAPPSARSGLAPSTPVASRGRSAAAVETKNDSIDALLENIVETRPAPMKTTPESSGRAAASYHAKHGLHRAQLTPVPEDKVIVDRQPQPPTLRLDRAQLVKAKAELDATTEDLPLHVPGRTRAQGARVVIALFGAMGIVFVMFIALKIWATKQRTDAMKTDPTASALVSIIPGSQAPSAVTSSANSPVGTPSAATPADTAAAARATEATTTSDVTNGTSDIAPPTTDVAPRAAKNPAPTSTRPAAATTAPGPAATAVTTATAPPPKDDVKRTLP